MPNALVLATVERVRARLRIRAALWSLAETGATAAGVMVVARVLGATSALGFAMSGVAGLAVGVWTLRRHARITARAAAACIERHSSLDNLVVTTVDLHEHPRAVSDSIREELSRQAEARVSGLDVTRVVPLGQPLAVGLAAVLGATAIMMLGDRGPVIMPSALEARVSATAPGIDSVTVQIVPPAYSGRPSESLSSPVQITVVAGSRVRLTAASAAEGLVAELAGLAPLALTRAGDGFVGEWLADRSTAVAIGPAGGAARDGDVRLGVQGTAVVACLFGVHPMIALGIAREFLQCLPVPREQKMPFRR